MPREDLVVTQYFLRLLHEPREGRRVVYAESLWEEPKALDLLGTHLLDGSVGEAFFGDYMRMHRDLLGAAASQYLPHSAASVSGDPVYLGPPACAPARNPLSASP